MSNESAVAPDHEIVRSILAGADAHVARVLDTARAQAASENERTKREAGAIAEAVLAEAEREAHRHTTRELAMAAVESRRLLLWAREERIAAVLARIESALHAVREDPARYRKSLLALAGEAVFATGGDRVVLRVAECDRELLDTDFLEAVKGAVRAQGGGEVEIEMEFTPDALAGGCVAATPDGRVTFDNTYGCRLERQRRALRMAIVREIGQGHE